MSGAGLLEKAIQYHDPNHVWNTFSGSFDVTMKTPDKPKRLSHLVIDLPKESFYLKMTRDTLITEYKITKSQCSISLNGEKDLSEETQKKFNLSCDRAFLYKNYYTYLYGLPMKLKDSGTIIDPVVKSKSFKEKTYLVLKVRYDKSVGSDAWYFYFNQKTYALEAYQFYRTDPSGNIKPGSGEYILLTDETLIKGIKMPKNRAWYTNKDDTYLGTDFLEN